MSEINHTKQRLRADLKARRERLPASRRSHEESAIRTGLMAMEALREAQTIFCFISHGDEVDTHALIDAWLQQGKRIVVPKILLSGDMIAVPFYDWSELQPGQLGIPTPVSSREYPAGIDVCITPGLGFTETGKRLGYGRGYYDRWFTRHPVEHRIAIAYDCQILADLPTDEQDIPVTRLVTSERSIEID